MTIIESLVSLLYQSQKYLGAKYYWIVGEFQAQRTKGEFLQ